MAISTEEYAERRERLAGLLEQRGIDALFVPPSSDLEYSTGIERDLPSFGNISYAHGWVTGAFLAPAGVGGDGDRAASGRAGGGYEQARAAMLEAQEAGRQAADR